jgi:hypothetical protein
VVGQLARPARAARAVRALYIDGGADFYQPEVNPLSGAASASDLAFATGRGPAVVADIEGRRPLVRADDVVVLACRTLLTGNVWAASRCRRTCSLLTGTRSAGSAPARRPARPWGT